MPKQYFTIKTEDSAGFADQIGTQFSRLHALGIILELEYIYSPLSFPRSIVPPLLTATKTIVFFLRCRILFSSSGNFFYRVLNKFLGKTENILAKVNKHSKDDALAKFIGFKNKKRDEINDIVYEDVFIDQLIDLGANTLVKLKQALNLSDQSKWPPTKGLRLCWANNSYKRIVEIDAIIKEAMPDYEHSASPFIKQMYWKNRELTRQPAAPANVILIHIRCGDSTVINLDNRKFVINESNILTDEELEKILLVDNNRVPIELSLYIEKFKVFASHFNPDAFRVVVISDGYKQTYQNFLLALLRYNNKISLTDEEKAILKIKIKEGNDAFNQLNYFTDTSFIIGESKEKLFQSIDALADAKILIWGCGGFAYNTNTLFKIAPSLLIHINDFNEEAVEAIKAMAAK